MKKTMLVAAVAVLLVSAPLVMVFSAGAEEAEPAGEVDLLYVEWADAIATTYVAQIVLEEMGYEVNVISVSAAAMWEGIAAGDADGMLAAWLPGTHGAYLEQTEDRVDLLSPTIEGARIGLMVPTYVEEVDSIADLNDYQDEFAGEIIGIDPGAGIMAAAERAIDDYGLGLTLMEGSDASMTAALSNAYENGDWIVLTGWTPHWKEAAFELKYLEDPEESFGGEEHVSAVARQGLAEDMPEVHRFLDNFHWSLDELGEILLWNEEDGADPLETAERWVADNRERVESWIP